jgi:3-deoxy-manno-octulosonate cytidylyltransferase (CMP-KDO synthetase)
MTILAVIPARFGASRFPGKPLADLAGRPVIQWVYEAAARCGAYDEVLVATESQAIADRVVDFGGRAELTREDHPTGTDRVAEIAERRPDADVVVNVQGDQPFATPEMLAALVRAYLGTEQPEMTTLACELTNPSDRHDPNVVKVVCDLRDNALYFSRTAIPHSQDGCAPALHHLGLYAFTRPALLRFASLSPTPLEHHERLEQLRALEHGMQIRVCRAEKPVLEINTPEDLAAAELVVASSAAESEDVG